MPFYRIGGLWMHLKLGGRKKPPPACVAFTGVDAKREQCCDISAFLCDWFVGEGKTCDAPLCEAHAHEVVRNCHYCPKHHAEHLRLNPQLGLFTTLLKEP